MMATPNTIPSLNKKHLLVPEIEVIRQLIDSLIADQQAEEVEANLYSARLHLTRAIVEAEMKEMAA